MQEITTSPGSTSHSSPIIEGLDSHGLDAGSPLQDETGSKCFHETDLQKQSITYQYLTFETPIPQLCPTRRPGDSSQPISPSLDLCQCESPFLWSSTRKTVILTLCCAATLCAAYSAGAYFMPSATLEKKWGLSTVAFNSGVTTWAVGFASSPMFLAPFSELNGRKPVFTGSGILFIVALIGCSLTDSFAGMLVARFFVGVGASTFATHGGRCGF
jgi:hypothetical protein